MKRAREHVSLPTAFHVAPWWCVAECAALRQDVDGFGRLLLAVPPIARSTIGKACGTIAYYRKFFHDRCMDLYTLRRIPLQFCHRDDTDLEPVLRKLLADGRSVAGIVGYSKADCCMPSKLFIMVDFEHDTNIVHACFPRLRRREDGSVEYGQDRLHEQFVFRKQHYCQSGLYGGCEACEEEFDEQYHATFRRVTDDYAYTIRTFYLDHREHYPAHMYYWYDQCSLQRLFDAPLEDYDMIHARWNLRRMVRNQWRNYGRDPDEAEQYFTTTTRSASE